MGVERLSKINSSLIIEYLEDMETGNNTAKGSKKGKRSYAQLLKLKGYMIILISKLQSRGITDIRKTTDKEITKLFSDMEAGILRKQNGEKYGDISTGVKVFKAFWHWHIKVNRKKGIAISDITEDLSSSPTVEAKFVYITKEQLDEMMPYFDKKEQTILMFVFDSLIRAPTELSSLRVKDIYEEDGEVCVNIPNDISKVRGRNFNLLSSGKAVIEYIQENKLKPDDYLFSYSNEYLNFKMQKVASQLWEDKVSHPKAGEKYNKITLYDLRHSGVIHLRIMAKDNPQDVSLDAIRERGGWTDFKMLNYYSRFIGIDGKISKVGIMTKKERNKLESEVEKLRNKIKQVQSQISNAPQDPFILNLKKFLEDENARLNLKKFKRFLKTSED